MHEDAARGRIAHGQHAPAHPFVPDVIYPAAPLAVAIQPGIVIPGTKNQGVELLYAAGAEHRKMESSRTIAGPESETERMFRRFLRMATHTTVNAQSAGALERQPAFRINHFHRDAPFPGSSALQRVNVNPGFP